jgi:hypothetical protein
MPQMPETVLRMEEGTLIMNRETIILTCFHTNVSKNGLRKGTLNLTLACPDLDVNTILREYAAEIIIIPAYKDQALPSLVHDYSSTLTY